MLYAVDLRTQSKGSDMAKWYDKKKQSTYVATYNGEKAMNKDVEKATERGWRVVNVDATIVAQRPRLAEHITAMLSSTTAGAERS
jgi:2C-methyl-D-erythritol 2,4-cyclodiphosphate synthase